MRRVLSKLLILLNALLICNCNSVNEEQYKSEFRTYMKEIHNFNLSCKDKQYMVVHMQGCNSCIENCMNLLNKLKDDYRKEIVVIYVGEYFGTDIDVLCNIEICKMYYESYLDYAQHIFSYQTGFAYPLYVSVKGGKIRKYIEVTEGNIEEVCAAIQNFSKGVCTFRY